jgi:hypothetical protein
LQQQHADNSDSLKIKTYIKQVGKIDRKKRGLSILPNQFSATLSF